MTYLDQNKQQPVIFLNTVNIFDTDIKISIMQKIPFKFISFLEIVQVNYFIMLIARLLDYDI